MYCLQSIYNIKIIYIHTTLTVDFHLIVCFCQKAFWDIFEATAVAVDKPLTNLHQVMILKSWIHHTTEIPVSGNLDLGRRDRWMEGWMDGGRDGWREGLTDWLYLHISGFQRILFMLSCKLVLSEQLIFLGFLPNHLGFSDKGRTGFDLHPYVSLFTRFIFLQPCQLPN